MTHTPGPWRFLENIVITDCNNLKTNRTHGYGCGNNFIASLNDAEYHEYSSAAEQSMNGHLIAAAPDLLLAGKHLAVKLSELYHLLDKKPSNCQAIRDFMAVVAKAEGRSLEIASR